jgi:hypothetical protein
MACLNWHSIVLCILFVVFCDINCASACCFTFAYYFISGNNNHGSVNDTAARTPTSELGGGCSIGDAIVLNLAPLTSAEHFQQPQSVMSTFKGSVANSCDVIGM